MIFNVGKEIAAYTPAGGNQNPQSAGIFNDFTTTQYKLSFFKTVTGLSFILLTGKDKLKHSSILEKLYTSIYVEYVSKNPMIDITTGESIKCPTFSKNVKSFFYTLVS